MPPLGSVSADATTAPSVRDGGAADSARIVLLPSARQTGGDKADFERTLEGKMHVNLSRHHLCCALRRVVVLVPLCKCLVSWSRRSSDRLSERRYNPKLRCRF